MNHLDTALDFANLFVDNQAGELLYFLIAVSLSLGALLLAFDQRIRSDQEREAGRYMVALGGVVLAWGALTAGSLFTVLDSASSATIIPPLERVVTALVLLLLTWAFLVGDSPRPERASTLVLSLLVVVIALGYVFSVYTWQQVVDTEKFNQHTLGFAWTIIPMVFSLAGMLLLFSRYSTAADIPLKFLFWVLVVAGHGYALYQMSQDALVGHTVGVVRLAMVAALALVPVIVYRLVIERFRLTLREVSNLPMFNNQAPPPPPVTLQRGDPPAQNANREALALLKIMGDMLEETNPRQIPRQIVKAVAASLKADVVALFAVQNPLWADPISGIDDVFEKDLPGMALNLENQPTIASAIELNIQVVLLPTRSMDELTDLMHRLDVQYTQPMGPTYIQPLSRNKKVIGLLVVAMPYSLRLLTDAERNLLESLGPVAARLFAITQESAPLLPEEAEASPIRDELQARLESQQVQVSTLNSQIEELRVNLQHERDKLAKLAASRGTSDLSITQQIDVLAAEREQLHAEREHLTSALQDARAVLASASATTDQDVYQQMIDNLESEKNALLRERQELERQFADLRDTPQDQQRLADVINTLSADRDRVKEERDSLQAALDRAQSQLSELGIEGGLLGYAQIVAHLTEERNRFLNQSKRAMAQRDKLLKEREQLLQQTQAAPQLDALQNELSRLAADREALIRQRDALKNERDALNTQREEWLETRISLSEQYDTLRRQYDQTTAALGALQSQKQSVHSIEEHRSDLEYKLLRAQDDLAILETEVARLTEQLAQNSGNNKTTERQTAETIVGLTQELRTPLTSIMGYTELMLTESTGILGETQRQFLLRVQVNVEQLMQLIENLVRVLAIDYGNLLLAPRPVDMLDLIDDSITHSSAQYREKGLNLHLNIADDLPPVFADPDALQQILSRLMINAYLAAPADSTVSISARAIADYSLAGEPQTVVHVAITDQGGGVPADEVARVFKRHYRAENPLIPGLGDKGAGLSIAQALVTAHGGNIWLESGGGSSTFQFVIPMRHHFGEKDVLRGKVSRLIDTLEG